MSILCPNCDAEIVEERLHRDAALACCGQCGTLWPLAGRAPLPRGEIAGLGYRLTFGRDRAQLDYTMRAGPAAANLGRVLVFLGIAALVFDLGLLAALAVRGAAAMPGFFSFFMLIPLTAGALALSGAGLFILYGRGRLRLDAQSAVLRRELWGMGREWRYRLHKDSRCEHSLLPFFQANSASKSGHTGPTTVRMPFTIGTLDGPLNFGFGVPPGERAAVAKGLNDFLDALTLPPDAFTIPRSAPTLYPFCPRCARMLGPASIDVPSVEVDCPFCHSRSPLSLQHARPPTPEEEQRDTLRPVPRPPKSRIVLERPDASRMVLYLPPRGLKGNPLGMFVFAVIWTCFSGGIGMAILFAMLTGPKPVRLVAAFPALILLLFLGIGVAMLYFSLRGAFSKKFLYVERGRVFLRTIFWGRTTDRERPRETGLRAEIVVAYRQNNNPVYRLQVGKEISFGSELEQAEKEWLLFEINRFLAQLDATPETPTPQG